MVMNQTFVLKKTKAPQDAEPSQVETEIKDIVILTH